MGAPGGEVPGRPRHPGSDTGKNRQEPITPYGVLFSEWLDRSVRGGRLGKDRSGPAISSACYLALDEIRRELERRRGYSPREISYGNLVEIAVDLLREHVFDRQGTERSDTSRDPDMR